MNGLLKLELLPQLLGRPRPDVEHAGEGERVAPVGVLAAVDLESRVIHAQAHVAGVLVGPEHVVDVKNDRLAGGGHELVGVQGLRGHGHALLTIHLRSCQDQNSCRVEKTYEMSHTIDALQVSIKE